MKNQRCVDCKNCIPYVREDGIELKSRKRCTIPFDLSAAPAVIIRQMIIDDGIIAQVCPLFVEK